MQKLKKLLIIISILVISIFSINSCNSILEASKATAQRSLNTTIANKVHFSLIETGRAKTLKAFAYKGGSLFKGQQIAHIAVWIKHPKGDFLFDTGLGDNIDMQFEEGMFLCIK